MLHIWALAKGWKWRETDHFVAFYDAKFYVEFGPKNAPPDQIVEIGQVASQVAEYLEQAYKQYEAAGFDMTLAYLPPEVKLALGVPGLVAGITLGQKTNVFLDPGANSAEKDKFTGNITLPHSFTNDAALRSEVAHEFFHAVQNSSFSWPGMAARRWWIEATADYAADVVAWSGLGVMSKLDPGYFQVPITHVDMAEEGHEYQTARFISTPSSRG